MAPFTCPTCAGTYQDPLDHLRKKHPTTAYTALQLQPLGLTPCPICGIACKGAHGIKTHSAKIHGTLGASRIPALRARDPPGDSPGPTRSWTFSPDLPPPPQRPWAPPGTLGLSRALSIAPTNPQAFRRSPRRPQQQPETTRPGPDPPEDPGAPRALDFSPDFTTPIFRYPGPTPESTGLPQTASEASGSPRAAGNPSGRPGAPRRSPEPRPGTRKRPARTPSPTNQPAPQRACHWNPRAFQATPEPKNGPPTLRVLRLGPRVPPEPIARAKSTFQLRTLRSGPPETCGAGKTQDSRPGGPIQKSGLKGPQKRSKEPLQPSIESPGTPQRAIEIPETPKVPSPSRSPTSLETLLQRARENIEGPTPSLPPRTPRGLLRTPRLPSETPETPAQLPGPQKQPTQLPGPQKQPARAPGPRKQPAQAPGPLQPPKTSKEAHDQALGPLLEKTSVQALLAYSRVPVPEKRLHARQANLFRLAAERSATYFLRNPKTKALLSFLLLPRVLGQALEKGDLAAVMRAYPATIPPPPDPPEPRPPSQSPSPITRAKQLLEKGYIGRASRALIDPTPLAEETAENLDQLREKHPIGAPNPFNSRRSPHPGQAITIEAINTAIASIGREKAPGLSGWNRPLLDAAIRGPDSPILAALRLLADMIRQGTAPGRDLLCASRLIGLQKPDGGVRPIAVGCLIYKIALKAILNTSFQPSCLLPTQLGVSSPGGVEPAVFLLQEAITGPNKAKTKKIASLDLSNAFNSTSRAAIASSVATYAPTFYKAASWAYNNPSLLVTEGGTLLASAEGVRQGDPLGPLLFSLAFRPTLEALQQALPKATIVAYLDDVNIHSPGPENLITAAAEVLKGSPFTLNVKKSTENTLNDLKKQGIKALGTAIGPLAVRRVFLQGKIDTLARAIKDLKSLPKQHALLLLQGSIQLLLRHLLRQLDPEGLIDLWTQVDTLIRDLVVALASRAPGRPSKDLQLALITLPIREGGLGLLPHADIAIQLYNTAKHASQLFLQPIRPLEGTPEPASSSQQVLANANKALLQQLNQGLTQGQQRALQENTSFLGRQWLKVLPTQKQHSLADHEITEALRNRLLAPCKSPTQPCNYCGALPTIGHEDLCKGASRHWIKRHNEITRAFQKALASRADLEVEIEPVIGPTSPTAATTALRADFSATIGASRYYYDIQVVAVNKASGREEALATLEEAAQEKRRKYSSLGPLF